MRLLSLPYEILVEIFILARYPSSFARANKSLLTVSKDSYARCRWLLYHFGKAHALFFGVSLGPYFISIEVVKGALANGAILSRYFLQKLNQCFGDRNPKLVRFRIDGGNRVNDNELQIRLEKSWASNLPTPVFLEL